MRGQMQPPSPQNFPMGLAAAGSPSLKPSKLKGGLPPPARTMAVKSQKRKRVAAPTSPSLLNRTEDDVKRARAALQRAKDAARSRRRVETTAELPPPKRHIVQLRTSPTEFVERAAHPLNEGAPPYALIGWPNKTYSRFDRIQPILDSMSAIACATGWRLFRTADELAAEARDDAEEAEAALAAPLVINATGFGTGCKCADKNRVMEKTKDGDSIACSICGAVGATIFTSLHREKNCSEDDDKTQRADRVGSQPADRFDRRAPTTEEARRQRERDARGMYFGKKSRQQMGIGWAAELVARKTALAERNRQMMTPRDQTKEIQILQKLEELFAPLEPIDDRVKRYLRMQTYLAWQTAVCHLNSCLETDGGASCQLNIRVKGAPIIAESALRCALDNLAKGVHKLDGVETAHIDSVRDKFRARSNGSGTSAAQRAVRIQLARLMAHASRDCEDVIPPCTVGCASPTSPSSSATGMSSPASYSPPSPSEGDAAAPDQMRQVHDYLDGLQRDQSVETALCDGEAGGAPPAARVAESPHSELLARLPSFVKRLQAVLPGGRTPAVAATIQVCGNPRTLDAALDAKASDARLSGLALQAFALVLTETVARRMARGVPQSRLPRRILQSLGISQEALEVAVDVVDTLLPVDAVKTMLLKRAEADDDRF